MGWKTRSCAGGGRRGEEEAGLWWGPSVWREEGQRVGVFWGGRWLGFCVAVGWEEVDLCGNLDWSLDVAGMLQALGEEGRRGAALWVDLKKQQRKKKLDCFFTLAKLLGNFCFYTCLLQFMFSLDVKL